MSPVRQRLTDYHDVDEALKDLCNGFPGAEVTGTAWQHVSSDDVPPPFHRLLVHRDHMTSKLADHYGRTVELRVLRQQLEGDLYHRQIVLTLSGSDTVIECGIVRVDLSYTPKSVREAILRRDAPLGDILIKHQVLRRIEPRWYLKFAGGSPLLASFDCQVVTDLFGRVGTIYCNDEPAIELLEIVTGASLLP